MDLDKHILQLAIQDSENQSTEVEIVSLEKRAQASKIAQDNKELIEYKQSFKKVELPPIGDLLNQRQPDPDRVQMSIQYRGELKNQVKILPNYFNGKIDSQVQHKKQIDIEALYKERVQSQAFQQKFNFFMNSLKI
jgi:hypothetical protein